MKVTDFALNQSGKNEMLRKAIQSLVEQPRKIIIVSFLIPRIYWYSTSLIIAHLFHSIHGTSSTIYKSNRKWLSQCAFIVAVQSNGLIWDFKANSFVVHSTQSQTCCSILKSKNIKIETNVWHTKIKEEIKIEMKWTCDKKKSSICLS